MNEYDYMDPSCPFDVGQFRKNPSFMNAEAKLDVKAILKYVDELNEQRRYTDSKLILEQQLEEAKRVGDSAAELGLLSELIGVYRKEDSRDKGINSVHDAFELVRELGLEGTATAGTVWVNGATALQEFGLYDEALNYYYMASRAYSDTIAPDDYRFASLLNNMGACFSALGRYDEALEHFNMALSSVKGNAFTPLEEAVTYINMAETYAHLDPPDDDMVEYYVDQCLKLFDDPAVPRDAYFSYYAKNCGLGLNELGFFRDAKHLIKMAEDINASIS